jgi:hypothetical protein
MIAKVAYKTETLILMRAKQSEERSLDRRGRVEVMAWNAKIVEHAARIASERIAVLRVVGIFQIGR